MSFFSSESLRRRDALGLRTKSVPALASAYSLKDTSAPKKLLAIDYTTWTEDFPHDSKKERAKRDLMAETKRRFEKRDEDERGLVAKEKKRQKALAEAEREQKAAIREREANARRASLVAAWRKEQEAQQRADAERKEQARLQQEREEQRFQELMASEREKRKPVECQSCDAKGPCKPCGGMGFRFVTFLSSSPGAAAKDLDFGTQKVGCESCQGCDHGIRGELQVGSGLCSTCGGAGRFCTGFCHEPMPTKGTAFRRRGSAAHGLSPTAAGGRPTVRASMSFFGSPPGSPMTRRGTEMWSPLSSPKTPMRGRRNSALGHSDFDGTTQVCPICKGSILPTLADARWIWAAAADAFADTIVSEDGFDDVSEAEPSSP